MTRFRSAVIALAIAVSLLLILGTPAYFGWTSWQTMEASVSDIRRQIPVVTPVAVSSNALEVKDALGIQKDLVQVETAARAGIAQLLAAVLQLFTALGLAGTLYFGWRNLRVAQSGQITSRFNDAIEHLGEVDDRAKPVVELRLGGIHALERISKDSPDDYWPVIELLTVYLRTNSAWSAKPERGTASPWRKASAPVQSPDSTPTEERVPVEIPPLREDLRAALVVLGRRKGRYGKGEPQGLVLRNTDLRGAVMQGAHLENSDFGGAHLDSAEFGGTHFHGANFELAWLQWAQLQRTDLRKATFTGAKLDNVNLEGADLRGTLLEGAFLRRANMVDSKLQKAQLSAARLDDAVFLNSNVTDANFINAELSGADLSKVRGLRREQLLGSEAIPKAFWDAKTRFPPKLRIPREGLPPVTTPAREESTEGTS